MQVNSAVIGSHSVNAGYGSAESSVPLLLMQWLIKPLLDVIRYPLAQCMTCKVAPHGMKASLLPSLESVHFPAGVHSDLQQLVV